MLTHSKILILGYGRSGKGAVKLAQTLHADIVVLDQKPIPESDHTEHVDYQLFTPELKLNFTPDIVVFSPGISPYSEFGKWAEKLPGSHLSELAFAMTFNTCPILAITGTNGKTTTTELTTHILKQLGYAAVSVGNIGNSFAAAVAEAHHANPPDVFVAEVSSFQLEKMGTLSKVFLSSVLTNITSDHIDRYPSFKDYQNVKLSIFKYTHKKTWANLQLHPLFHETPCRTFSAQSENANFFVRDNIVYKRTTGHIIPIIEQNQTRLFGLHNAENMMGALAIVSDFIPDFEQKIPQIREALRSFCLGPHRMDCFATDAGKRFVDDSKGTNPDAVCVAVRHFAQGKNVRLILGGLDKGMDFKLLIPLAPMISKAYLYGQAKETLYTILKKDFSCECIHDFEDCTRKAYAEMDSNDVLILSPACASMDQFKDYAERGLIFQKIIHNLLKVHIIT